ncbi:MAG: hypothetical protein E7552_06845, partial [Ruminococcaceae bacterium]|nr:hypothetical protein [Oscillospiraceae bacterium]
MKDFLRYFFGKGDTAEFQNFTLAHFLPILVGGGVIALIWYFHDTLARSKYEPKLRWALAFALILSEFSYFWRLVALPSLGANAVDHLPITVCGWAVIFCSYMLRSE